MCDMSATIGSLAAALAKAQGEMSAAQKSSDNTYFKSKYADLSECWESCRGPLSKNGLAVIQTTEIKDGDAIGVVVNTTLAHSSGEWIRGTLFMPLAKKDPQAVGSAITYGRRYGMSAIVGIVADDDDDGEAAMGRAQDGKTAAKQPPRQRPQPQAPQPTAHEQATKTLKNLLVSEEGVGLKPAEVAGWIRRILGREDIKGFDSLSPQEVELCLKVARDSISMVA